MKRIIQRGFAWGIDQVMRAYEPRIADRKRMLLGDLRGKVLEIGPGTGPNLKYFSPEIEWLGVEPNPFMHKYLRQEAARRGIAVDVIEGSAMDLPLADASVDVVVGTLVLCSVPCPATVVREVYRVLKPGGRYVFVEHVAGPAGSTAERVQKWIKPVWRCCADGCHVDRRTWEVLAESPFESTQVEHFQLKFPVVGPHIMGFAERTFEAAATGSGATVITLPAPEMA